MIEKIRELCKAHGISIYSLEKVCGLRPNTIYKWDQNVPSVDKVKVVANYFGVSIDALIGDETPSTQGVRIPVFGYIRAGIPLEAIQEIIDYEEISPELASRGRYFALQVKGDSMMPDLREGDTVIVKEQATAENGDTAIVLVNGDEATVKRVLFTDKGLTLLPTNTAYAPMVYTRQQVQELPVQIIGKVVELRRKL